MFTKATPYYIEVNFTISRKLILSLLSKRNFNSLTLTGLVEIVVLDFGTEALKDLQIFKYLLLALGQHL